MNATSILFSTHLTCSICRAGNFIRDIKIRYKNGIKIMGLDRPFQFTNTKIHEYEIIRINLVSFWIYL